MSKAQRPVLALSPAVAGPSDFSIPTAPYSNIQYTIYKIQYNSPSDFSILFYDYGAPYSDPTDFIHCKSILLKNKTLN